MDMPSDLKNNPDALDQEVLRAIAYIQSNQRDARMIYRHLNDWSISVEDIEQSLSRLEAAGLIRRLPHFELAQM